MRCASCNNEVTSTTRICPSCGHRQFLPDPQPGIAKGQGGAAVVTPPLEAPGLAPPPSTSPPASHTITDDRIREAAEDMKSARVWFVVLTIFGLGTYYVGQHSINELGLSPKDALPLFVMGLVISVIAAIGTVAMLLPRAVRTGIGAILMLGAMLLAGLIGGGIGWGLGSEINGFVGVIGAVLGFVLGILVLIFAK